MQYGNNQISIALGFILFVGAFIAAERGIAAHLDESAAAQNVAATESQLGTVRTGTITEISRDERTFVLDYPHPFDPGAVMRTRITIAPETERAHEFDALFESPQQFIDSAAVVHMYAVPNGFVAAEMRRPREGEHTIRSCELISEGVS